MNSKQIFQKNFEEIEEISKVIKETPSLYKKWSYFEFMLFKQNEFRNIPLTTNDNDGEEILLLKKRLEKNISEIVNLIKIELEIKVSLFKVKAKEYQSSWTWKDWLIEHEYKSGILDVSFKGFLEEGKKYGRKSWYRNFRKWEKLNQIVSK